MDDLDGLDDEVEEGGDSEGDAEADAEELALLEDGEEVSDYLDSEDEDMALNLANETSNAATGMPDLQVVQMRLASATRALGDWKSHGAKTGKSRSEVFEQLIDDIGNYYGYNKFLAEKLVELFPVEEVCLSRTSRWKPPSHS